MAENVSLQDVKNAIKNVMHPAINCSLVDLGIVKDVTLDGKSARITLVLPALGIPSAIINYFKTNLSNALQNIGVSLDTDIREMDDEEKQKFFSLEQEKWKGL
jgi:ATP-binding protein involved in chromosome partitioning